MTLVGLMLGVTWGVFAQWGGPDQEILRNPQNSQMVTLSVLDASPNVCYIWSGRNIQGDNKQPSVQANPIDSVSRYHVQRIGPMGVEEDEVVVRLLDSVKIVSVEPIKNCYQNNDPILMDFIAEAASVYSLPFPASQCSTVVMK